MQSLIVDLLPTIVSRSVERSITAPACIDTFGPTVAFVSSTPSSMYTGSMDRRARRRFAGATCPPALQHRAIRLEQRIELPRIVPALDIHDFDLRALVDHVLEGVGEIVLALVRRLLQHVIEIPSYSSFQFLM